MYNPYDLSWEEIYPDMDCNGNGHDYSMKITWHNDVNDTTRDTLMCKYCWELDPKDTEPFDEEFWWKTKD